MNEQKKIKILVADDHQLFREGLCRIINDEDDFEVIGEAADGQEAITMTGQYKPDVVILDVAMPAVDGIEATEQIKTLYPDVAVLIVSAYDYESYLRASVQAGAAGYMQKNAPANELINAIRLIHSGKSVFDFAMVRKVFTKPSTDHIYEPTPLSPLNKREIDVIRSAAKGNSNKQIAAELDISARTVQSHMVNIFRKLGASSRTEAVLLAMREGWLMPGDLP